MGMLNGKNLVIIGGTSGIGLASARAFLREGARVVAVGSSSDSVLEAEQVLGSDARVLQADAREPGTAEHAIETCQKLFSGFDGLYHVAGGSGRKWGDGPLHEGFDLVVRHDARPRPVHLRRRPDHRGDQAQAPRLHPPPDG